MFSKFVEEYHNDTTDFSMKDPRSDYSLNLAGLND